MIRLFRFDAASTSDDIRINLQHHGGCHIAKPVSYVALSYCWGDRHKICPITVNGKRFLVGWNLHLTLIDVLRWGQGISELFWVDALCINQADTLEKGDQVHQMWRIFQQAHTVLAWLGPEPEAFPDANAVRHVLDPDSNYGWFRGLQYISERPYFTRTWIVTEVAQSQDLLFMCGSSVCHWEVLRERIRMGISLTPNGSMGATLRTMGHLLMDKTISSLCPKPRVKDVISVASMYIERQCRDERDCIFVMLGHPYLRAHGDYSLFVRDYSLTQDELFLSTIAWVDTLDAQISRATVINHGKDANELALLLAHILPGYIPPNARRATASIDHYTTFRSWLEQHHEWDCSNIHLKGLLSRHLKGCIRVKDTTIDVSGSFISQQYLSDVRYLPVAANL